jgi:YidC/Oxa1 family membrane protein insertase
VIQLFNTILYQPLFNFLVILYNIIPGHDIGLVIIILTIIVRIILYPFAAQSIKAQKALTDLQPKIDEIKEKYKDQKDKMLQEMTRLYSENKINPFSSCLPLLIQLPLLIAVYQVFKSGLGSKSLEMLYSFVTNPGHLNSISFGFLDLSKPNLVLAILTGLAQYWQTKMLPTKTPPKNISGSKDESMVAMMNKQMLYFMPLFTVFVGVTLPSGLLLYWFISTIFTIVQQYLFFRKDKKGSMHN